MISMVIRMNRLKEARMKSNLTQVDAAKYLQISRKTFQNYEANPLKVRADIYNMYCDKLEQLSFIDEEHGILSIDTIREIVTRILNEYDVKSCYLFGSYARNEATRFSDVDLLIDSSVTGLGFYGLVEELRCALCKKVDLLNLEQMNNNTELLSNILKEGIKIYG